MDRVWDDEPSRVGEKNRGLIWGLRHATAIAATSLALVGCITAPSSLRPQGPAAARIAELWWIMLAAGTAVWVFVVAVLLVGLLHRRREETPDDLPPGDDRLRRGNAWIVGGGIVMPVVVLIGLIGLTVGTLRAMANPAPFGGTVIDVIGHQWWWEVRYPEHDVITANEIHIPAGEPVEIRLSSVDVIHSFWVPELHGKFDLIPGRINTFVLEADQPGEYRGQCAEFCGLQHAKMALLVVAEPPDDFRAWLDQQAQPASDPVDALALAGQRVFLESKCADCHTLRGTSAAGQTGPDLTHFASRRTLAAGTAPNTPDHLAAWLFDPQTLKPGNQMTATDLGPEALRALAAYLGGLK